MAKKRVLILGADGFTGRHLVRLLSLDTSREVHVSGSVGDVKPDEIYQLRGSYTNIYNTDYESNVLATKAVLDAVSIAGLRSRVLLIGSSAEYGFPLSPLQGVSEEHPLMPVSVYGLVKVFQTKLMEAYVRLYGVDIVAVRPFNLLGTGMSPRLFVGKMEQEIERYKRGEISKIITGDLSVERDYIAIDEAIGYYRRVMEKGKTGEIYNVGKGNSVSLREVLLKMLTSAGLSMDIVQESVHEVPGKIVVPKIFANISKLKQLT
ncbi:MAG: NAD-dependent epimerase/dehydratase family protein [bacterium]|nr:NAD-dependent epimerase/dehydratase family protein [bacterium]